MTTQSGASPSRGAGFGDELAALADRIGRSMTEIVSRDGRALGAGVVWEGDIVITSAHVARAREAEVRLSGGEVVSARVIARDDDRDLAALRPHGPSTALHPAEAGDSDALRPGELVLALGHPLGIREAASVGVVHRASALGIGGRRWIEADVRLAPGNSGGPLADARGRVVGINAMVSRGLAFAVPVRAVSRLLHGGASPTLGIAARPVLVRDERWSAPALVVLEVAPHGIASTAGVRMGDIIVGAGGRRFAAPADLRGILEEWEPMLPLTLELLRGGTLVERVVRLAPAA